MVNPKLAAAIKNIEIHSHDPQTIYTYLTQIYDILALAHSTLSIDTNFPPAVVRLLQQLLQEHTHHEEVLWYICRILLLCLQASNRVQWEAGHIQMWNDFRNIRKLFPDSLRILESSLKCDQALLYHIEYHQLQARPARSIVDEMLFLMDRFAAPPSHILRTSPHGDFRTIVVCSLDVLVTMYSSPRVAKFHMQDDSNPTFTCRILDLMLETLDCFIETEKVVPRTGPIKSLSTVSVWLNMARIQLEQQIDLAIVKLFPSGKDKGALWIPRVIHAYSTNPNVIIGVCGVLTLIFDVPDRAIKYLSTLPHVLLIEHGLLSLFCQLWVHYQSCRNSDVALELIRVLRQWSDVTTMLALFPKFPDVKTYLLPQLVTQLTECHSTLIVNHNDKILVHQACRMLIEISLLLQHLLTVQIYLALLCNDPTFEKILLEILQSTMSLTEDSEIVLLQRELKKSIQILKASRTSSKEKNPLSGSSRKPRLQPKNISTTKESKQ